MHISWLVGGANKVEEREPPDTYDNGRRWMAVAQNGEPGRLISNCVTRRQVQGCSVVQTAAVQFVERAAGQSKAKACSQAQHGVAPGAAATEMVGY